MTTARKKEREKRRRKAWTPLFGFFSLVVFGGFSWVVAPQVRPLVEARGLVFPGDWPVWAGNALVAFVIFVVLFAVAMALVAVFAGSPTGPHDVRTPAKQMQKQIRERERHRSKY